MLAALLLLALSAPALAAPSAGGDPCSLEALAAAPPRETAPPVIEGKIDWQGHPAMHLTWPMFAPGLVAELPKERTWRHMFKQTVTTPWLEASGVRVFLAAAMAAERARNPTVARRRILAHLAYVEAFVADNPARFALARTPAQARCYLEQTDKLVLIHSIEGGRRILLDPGDARFWADQGVALVTVMHLFQDELGGPAVNGAAQGWWITPRTALKRTFGGDRGLTERGEAAMVELDAAGILVDLSHMSPDAVEQALALSRANGIAPVVTHGKLASLRPDERAFTDAQILELYRLGGSFNLILDGATLEPWRATLPVPADHCPDSYDNFKLHHEALRDLLEANAAAIFEEPGLTPDDLSQDQEIRLASGWASDWNGWTSHTPPRFGRRGCPEEPEGSLAFDEIGLAHPGLLPEHWARLEGRGADLSALDLSAEQFLRMWEAARGDALPADPGG